MHLLAIHKIARSGDGLVPELLRLLWAREVQADARIVPLRRFNPAIPETAGAWPDRPSSGDDARLTSANQRQ